MNYIIASIQGHHTGFEASINNQNTVSIRQHDTEDEFTTLNRTSKTYATREEAKEAFMKISICILDGTYSFEDRAAML
ncbi:MAG: hypothetical protein FWG63_00740 [Defluviitaleaceae bacterium]|nr:hypothetical protein [Defluviitaleaceae bacterium]